MTAVKIILRVLIALGCVGICVLVLLQPSKDGMSSALTGVDDQSFGSVTRKTRPQERFAFWTKILAAAVGVLCVVTVFLDRF